MIFISYSEKERAAYTSLCAVLKSENLDYWDPRSMKAGGSLKDQLREAINECGICIFIATRNSIESEWCLAETGAFWGAGKRIILYKANQDIDFPPLFRGDLWTDDVQEVVRQVKEEISAAGDTKQTSSSLNQGVQSTTNPPPRPPDPQDLLQRESDGGIISKADLMESDERKPNEVFAIELLTEPIILERKDGQTLVKIDRSNVSQCVMGATPKL